MTVCLPYQIKTWNLRTTALPNLWLAVKFLVFFLFFSFREIKWSILQSKTLGENYFSTLILDSKMQLSLNMEQPNHQPTSCLKFQLSAWVTSFDRSTLTYSQTRLSLSPPTTDLVQYLLLGLFFLSFPTQICLQVTFILNGKKYHPHFGHIKAKSYTTIYIYHVKKHVSCTKWTLYGLLLQKLDVT